MKAKPAPPGERRVAGSRWMRGTRWMAQAVGVALFAALALTFVVQVGARLVFSRPLPWTDELAVLLYLASVLWAGALLVPWREHVAMDLAYAGAPRGARRAMVFVGGAAVAGLAVAAAPATLDYLLDLRRDTTPVLGWSLALVYAPFALLLAAMALRGAGVALDALRGRLPEDGSGAAQPGGPPAAAPPHAP